MTHTAFHFPRVTKLTAPALPRWVTNWVGGGAVHEKKPLDGVMLESIHGDGGACVKATIDAAGAMTPVQFKNRVGSAYLQIERQLAFLGSPWVLRYWNFIPAIHQACGEWSDHYMAFNAGRYEVIERLGVPANPLGCAASAVGYDGTDLVIAALGAADRSVAVENPRQVPAVQYSPKYGPVPPSFARGSLICRGGRQWLLGSGTASVVGEDSRHPDDLNGQLEETLRNIAALINAAIRRHDITATRLESNEALSLCLDARVYLRRVADEAAVIERLRKAMVNLKGMEIVQAEICRQELMVEVEPLACL